MSFLSQVAKVLVPGMLLALGTGCPFVFGAPDYSNVSADADTDTDTDSDIDTDTDTDTDVDTDTDTDTDSDSDTGTEVILHPLVQIYTLAPKSDRIVATLKVTHEHDTDDLGIGKLIFTNPNATPIEFDIGTMPEFVTGTPFEFTLVDKSASPCQAYDETWTVVLEDKFGVQSAPIDQTAVFNAIAAVPSGDPFFADVGIVIPPVVVCGTIADKDTNHNVLFKVPTDGTYKIDVNWEPPATDIIDTNLCAGPQGCSCLDGACEEDGEEPNNTIDTSESSSQPEVLEATLTANSQYAVYVFLWDDTKTNQPYTIDIKLVTP